MRKARSAWRRWLKGWKWTGDVSRDGLAAALKRRRRERDRIYGTAWRPAAFPLKPAVQLPWEPSWQEPSWVETGRIM